MYEVLGSISSTEENPSPPVGSCLKPSTGWLGQGNRRARSRPAGLQCASYLKGGVGGALFLTDNSVEVKVPSRTRGQISRPEHVTHPALSPSFCVPHAWPMGTLARAGGRGLCRKGHNIFMCGDSGPEGPSCKRVGLAKDGVRGLRECAWWRRVREQSGQCGKSTCGSPRDPSGVATCPKTRWPPRPSQSGQPDSLKLQ